MQKNFQYLRSELLGRRLRVKPTYSLSCCVMALEQLVDDGRISADERVVLFNTGAASKYIETVPLDLPTIDNPQHVDYAALV